MGFEISSFPNGVSVSATKSLLNISYNSYSQIATLTPDANLNPWGFSAGLAAFRASPYSASELKYYDHTFPYCSFSKTSSGDWATYQNGEILINLSKYRSWMRNPNFTISAYVVNNLGANYEVHNLAAIIGKNITTDYITVTLNPSVTVNSFSVFGGNLGSQYADLAIPLNQNSTYYLVLAFEEGSDHIEGLTSLYNYNVITHQVNVGQQQSNLLTLGYYVDGTESGFGSKNFTAIPKLSSNNSVSYLYYDYVFSVIDEDPANPVQSIQVTFDSNNPYYVNNMNGGSATLQKVVGTGTVRVALTLKENGYVQERHEFDWYIDI